MNMNVGTEKKIFFSKNTKTNGACKRWKNINKRWFMYFNLKKSGKAQNTKCLSFNCFTKQRFKEK